ncbi:hypothetical protein [Falsirhodobacter xinxiangensis]|uniref:hypothetical protein n=1 Tax=Falsirhodobacter xinxiangensis TaxID=2530049 RepID=UPI0010A9B944|nr:hypothetical protein [Rhodobacter xinxiangensis]
MATMLPVSAMAQGTRHDIGSKAGEFGIDITLTDGIGLSQPRGGLTFELEKTGATETFELSQIGARRVEGGTAYRLRVAANERERATAFWDRHGAVEDFTPNFPLCRTSARAPRESIRYSLYLPGFGSTPQQEMSGPRLARILRQIAPCPTPERAD